jgi:hypothetical protein
LHFADLWVPPSSASIVVTFAQVLSISWSPSTRAAGENGRMCCEGSHHRRAPMRSRRSGPGRPSGDAEASGRRVTSKAPLAHLVGGSGRPEASPTTILQDTHSLEGMFSAVGVGHTRGGSYPLSDKRCSHPRLIYYIMDERIALWGGEELT